MIEPLIYHQKYPYKRTFLAFGVTLLFSLMFFIGAIFIDYIPIRMVFFAAIGISWIAGIIGWIFGIFTRMEIDDTKISFRNIIAHHSYFFNKYDYILLEKDRWYFPHQMKRKFNYKTEFFKLINKYNQYKIAEVGKMYCYQSNGDLIFSRLPEKAALKARKNDYDKWIKSIVK